jgi:hypothetical protein
MGSGRGFTRGAVQFRSVLRRVVLLSVRGVAIDATLGLPDVICPWTANSRQWDASTAPSRTSTRPRTPVMVGIGFHSGQAPGIPRSERFTAKGCSGWAWWCCSDQGTPKSSYFVRLVTFLAPLRANSRPSERFGGNWVCQVRCARRGCGARRRRDLRPRRGSRARSEIS